MKPDGGASEKLPETRHLDFGLVNIDVSRAIVKRDVSPSLVRVVPLDSACFEFVLICHI